MLFRSTGLGKTELKAKPAGMSRQGDYLILQVDTLEPVRWKIRAAFSMQDLWTIIKFMLSFSNLKIMFSGRWFRDAEHPGEF